MIFARQMRYFGQFTCAEPARLDTIMDRIDDRLDVAMKELLSKPENAPFEIAIRLGGAMCGPIGVVGGELFNSVFEHFSTAKRIDRMRDFLTVLKARFQALEDQTVRDRERLEAIIKKLNSPEFSEALASAAEIVVRTANREKVNRLANVLANGSDPSFEPSSDDDLTSFIHDVSQLSEGDIQVLGQLASTLAFAIQFADVSQKAGQPEFPLQSIIEDAQREKLFTEDFYSYCFRLVGFGLAAQMPHNSPSVAAGGPIFRLTNRGRRLAALLKQRT